MNDIKYKKNNFGSYLQRFPALTVTGIYIAFGLLWIIFSDRFLASTFSSTAQPLLQTLKGFAYVLITGVLLYGLIRYFTRTLRQQNKRYRLLFDENPLPMWICDTETLAIQDVNLSACRHYGYDHGHFLTLRMGDLETVSPPLILKQLNQHLPSGTLKHFDKYKNSMDIWISYRQLPQELLIAAHDITQQKNTERALRDAKEHLEVFHSAIDSAFILLTLDSNLRIQDSNTHARKALNIQNTDVAPPLKAYVRISSPPLDALPPLLRPKAQIPLTLQTEQVWIQGILICGYADEDRDPLYLFIGQDITEQERLRHNQAHMQKSLIQQNQDLQQFTYIVSHNLRAPVANQLGLLQLFNQENPEDPFNQELLDKLKTSAERIDKTLQDLNNILSSRGDIERQQECMMLDLLCQDIWKHCTSLMPHKNAALTLDLEENEVWSARAYLTSIFNNIISNAIKYRSPERPLQLHIHSTRVDQQIKITFQDNGRGIDLARYGNKIFGFYQRFHHEIEGRGMGLYLVKNHAENLGGSIDVDSTPDEGTCFTLWLPARGKPASRD